jgi:methyl-accepting chemotaxis protein
MSLRDSFSRIVGWLRSRRAAAHANQNTSDLNDEGLMFHNASSASPGPTDQPAIKAVAVRGKSESLEKLQAGFDRLIDELSGINDHLRRQVAQHEDLITRIDQLPKLLESFPAVVENQKVLTEGLIEQLKANLLRNQQIADTIEKIPAEAAKQTDVLVNIDQQLTAAANVDAQATETFNKFNESLEKLNQSTKDHTHGISQMSRTFAASDRYLKFIVTRQTRQFMWVFYSVLVVCIVVILIFVGIILYLAR